MESVDLMREILLEEKEIKELEDKIKYLKLSITYKEKKLKEMGKETRYLAEKSFIRKVLKLEDTSSDIYVLFDKYGNIKGTKDIRYFSTGYPAMSKWLDENKLYAECSTSFNSKSEEWYNKTLLEQLETLDWKVEHGELITNKLSLIKES